ncbi:MAG: elongation factor 4 [Deltaproteobacteria bacterium]|nr:MAG: elongation factor 4 [Deltaproteobacteria bacterium]
MSTLPKNQANIRNFSIIAHIDHGKSTLADRILEYTGILNPREMRDQFLDKMEIERERGVTIKSQTVSIYYRARNNQNYSISLIDTPGHIDFNHEVSRSLSACEGALLIIDGSQGIQAQTLTNAYLALENNLEIVPVINKIDLETTDFIKTSQEIEKILGINASLCIAASGKTGFGIVNILESIIHRIPPPQGDPLLPLQALIIDSWFDNYRGVIILIKVFNGRIEPGKKILFMSSLKEFLVQEVGIFNPNPTFIPSLICGDVGFVIANIKTITDAKVGDTITQTEYQTHSPILKLKESKPMVFAGIFPINSSDFENLQKALLKLSLNDASLSFSQESSQALGLGFRCGFLGLFHMEIIKERLQREFNLDIIVSAPSTTLRVTMKAGQSLLINNPSQLPNAHDISSLEEPYITSHIYSPSQFIGAIMLLAESKRGKQIEIEYMNQANAILTYEFPMAEIIFDFFDKLKSISKGYATLDYTFKDFQKSDLVKIDILLNNKIVDSLSFICHRNASYNRGKLLCQKIKETLSKHQYPIAIQAAIGSKIISRETLSALRKDVTAKCYGGDISRKRKLLEKQKQGKKKMKQFGSINIPQETFLSILKID